MPQGNGIGSKSDYGNGGGVTEQLKSENPMEWVRRVNGIKVRVEEEIVNQLI